MHKKNIQCQGDFCSFLEEYDETNTDIDYDLIVRVI
jgi:hypothetical protein